MNAPYALCFANNAESWSTLNFLRAERLDITSHLCLFCQFQSLRFVILRVKMCETGVIRFNEQLIEEVKKYPSLYNKKERDYKNIVKKMRIWEDIAKILNLRGGIKGYLFFTYVGI